MKRLLIFITLLLSISATAQLVNRDGYVIFMGNLYVGHPRTGSVVSPNANVHLQLGDSATSKALWLPRVQDTSAVLLPRQGMMVYSISDASVYFRNPTIWVKQAALSDVRTIYNADDTLTGNRIVYGDDKNLSLANVDSLNLYGESSSEGAVLSLDSVLYFERGKCVGCETRSIISTSVGNELYLYGGVEESGVILTPNRYNLAAGNVRVSNHEAGFSDLNFFSGGGSEVARVGITARNFFLRGIGDSTSVSFKAEAPASVYVDSSRFSEAYGDETPSGNNLTLPFTGNTFNISGTTQLNAIATHAWQPGSIIRLKFISTVLVKDNTSGSAGTAKIQLSGNIDYTTSPGDILQLLYDGTEWTEIGRLVAATPGGVNAWPLTGIVGTNPSVNFVGTLDNVPLAFRVANNPSGRIYSQGRTSIGYLANWRDTGSSTSSGNTAFGYMALEANNTPPGFGANTAVGYEALKSHTGGSNPTQANTAVGFRSLLLTTTGVRNTAVGLNAGYSNTTGSFSTLIGGFAGEWNNGQALTAVGLGASRYNTSGVSNTSVGGAALELTTTVLSGATITAGGSGYTTANAVASAPVSPPAGGTSGTQATFLPCVVSGGQVISCPTNVPGVRYPANATITITGDGTGATASPEFLRPDNNTAIGANSLFYNTTGYGNTALGESAGIGNNSSADYRTMIDSNCLFLGRYASRNLANPSTASMFGSTTIGYNAKVAGSRMIVLGATGSDQPNVGIGTESPSRSALLDLTSTSHGFLIPRVTTTQQNAISTPSTGLLVYNTDSLTVAHYNGSTWEYLGAGSSGTSYSFSSPLSESAGTVFIQNAVADGSTKGAASFTAADFNSSTGNISIDYANGQAASGSVNGFMTTGTQEIAGAKTFSSAVISNGDFFSDQSSNADARIGQVSSLPGIWFGASAGSPSLSNFAFLQDGGGNTILNTPAGTTFYTRVGNVNIMAVTPTGGISIGTTGYATNPGANNVGIEGKLKVGGNSTPAASAVVEMVSTTAGFLPPRMTSTQASAISSPAEGLLVYVTDTNGTFTSKGWWGYNGSAWEKLNN
jgi:hypothetical protein